MLFIFAITALGVYGVVLAGWAANSKYSLLGGLRSSAQMFSYELALGLSWVGIIMLAGSFQIADIVNDQGARFGGWFLGWNAFVQFPAFLVYFIAATAEVARIPFDLPEGETELVAGFHTEYSSMRFALIQMAEYINMITVSVLCTNLFLGGWHAGVPGLPSEGLLGFVWWGLKVALLLFVFIWLRGTLPRFRYDQLMHFGWKVLIPVAAVWILVTATAVTFLPALVPGREPLMDAILFYVFAGDRRPVGAGGDRPEEPALLGLRAHRHAVLDGRDLRPARLAVHRRAAGDRLRRRDHGPLPLRADAAQRAARGGPAAPGRPRARRRSRSSPSLLLVAQAGCGARARASRARPPQFDASTRKMAEVLFSPHFLYVFEATSILILAALVGAVALAKKEL